MPREPAAKSGPPSENRNKPERPRDLLGRPLAWGAENQLVLEDFDSLTLEANHELARAHARAGRWFQAHEAWETAWKQAKGSHDAEFFKGLSQMGAGYVHLLRGNAHGAQTLLRRAASRISRYPNGHAGIATSAVSARLLKDAAAVERGDLVPGAGAWQPPLDV
jgi:uncharacterized protein